MNTTEEKVFCGTCEFYSADNPRGPGACKAKPAYQTHTTEARSWKSRVRIGVDSRNKNNDCNLHQPRIPLWVKIKKLLRIGA